MRGLFLFLVTFRLAGTLVGQGTFIPDPQFRAKLNEWAPGLVDANGFMMEDHSGFVPQDLDLLVDWTPADLTGIQALSFFPQDFPGMGLITLRFDQGVQVTLDSIGPCAELSLFDYPLSELPHIASTGTLRITGAPFLAEIDLQGVVDVHSILELNDVSGLVAPPVLPDTMHALIIRSYPSQVPLPLLPASLIYLKIENCDHASLSGEFPIDLEQLFIDSMPNLNFLPAIPPNLLGAIRIANSGLQSFESIYEVGYTLELYHLPELTTITALGGAPHIAVEDVPALTSIHLAGPIGTVNVLGALQLNEVVLEEGMMELRLVDVGALDIVSGFPLSLQALEITRGSAAMLPPFNEGLISLLLSDVTVTELPALPSTLTWLLLERCPILELPSLPDGLSTLIMVNDVPVACLPVLPAGLQYLELSGTLVTCMPNHPPAVPQFLPLCTVLNSSCPEYVPYVAGRVYRDDNMNGEFDPDDLPLPFATVTATPSGYMTGTDSLGFYTLALPLGAHTLSVSPGVPDVLSIAPTAHQVELSVPMDVNDSLDFAVEVDTLVPDLRVWNEWGWPLKPGFSNEHVLIVSNHGTTRSDVEVTLELEPWLEITDPNTGTVDGTRITWSLDSLEWGEQRMFVVSVVVPATVDMGTPVSSMARVDPFAEDIDTLNNVHVSQTIVVSSYDPNDKQVFPAQLTEQQGAAGEQVEYLIRFQNTGTAAADRVLITDTLSADLDLATFEFIAASHASSWFYREGALHFLFAPIFLPDSTSDEPGSHGWISFRINTRSGLLPGASIPNQANIYFDFNEPVITAPCLLAVEVPQHMTSQDAAFGMSVHPVPASDILFLRHGGEFNGAHYTLLDVGGRIVSSGTLMSNETPLDLVRCTPGIYQIRVIGQERTALVRFVVE